MSCAIKAPHLWSLVHYPAKNISETVTLSGIFIAGRAMNDANAMEIMQFTIFCHNNMLDLNRKVN